MDELDVAARVAATAVSVAILMGLGVRFILVPYLRDNLIRPVEEVHRATTENHHTNAAPTLPDRIDDLSHDVTALANVLEGHLTSSDKWLDNITARLTALEGRLANLTPRHRGP